MSTAPAPELREQADLISPSSKRAQVAMLTTVHQAVDVRIFHREAKTLAEAGFQVAVIGPHTASEELDGVFIEALPRPASRLQRALFSIELFNRARRRRALFIFHDPELLWVGAALRLLGRKVIYDSHENFPKQILQKLWLPAIARWALFPIAWITEFICSRLLTGVIVVGDTYRWRFPRKRTTVVRNFAPLKVISSASAVPVEKRKPIVIYVGGLSELRGITELVRAFAGLNDIGAELLLMGPFHTESYQREILAMLPPNARWLGQKSYSEVLELYRIAKIGAVLHHPAPNHTNAFPIKMFEYMAAGLPIVTSSLPHFRDIVEGCGVQVDSRNVDQIRETFRDLLQDAPLIKAMSKVARERVLTSYSWESEGRKLIDLCARLTKS